MRSYGAGGGGGGEMVLSKILDQYLSSYQIYTEAGV